MCPDTDPSVLIDSMAGGLYVVNLQRVITYWNAGAERVTGYGETEVLGHPCGEGLLDHCDEEGESLCGARCPLVATMRDGVERHARLYARHRDGHRVPLLVTARALRDEAGVITGAVETFTDDTGAAETEARLRDAERLANTDALTGLGNRRSLEALLAQRLRGGKGEGLSVLALDIDRFKMLNDNHGHAFGDEVLSAVAHTLVDVASETCEVFRIGGDEFIIVHSSSESGEAEALAATVREGIAGLPLSDQGIALHITVSVGVAHGVNGETARGLVSRADEAMLEAKRGGRNAVVHAAIASPRAASAE